MDYAVSQRKYAEAEQHRARISEITEEKALATGQEQSSPSPIDPSSRVSQVDRSVALQRTDSPKVWDTMLLSRGQNLTDFSPR